MDLEPGQAIGPYRIVSQLGRGGMGAVYLATDRRLGRKVALKFLHTGSGTADDDRRLMREARAASALNHPNICQLFDIGGGEPASWIAMEYLEGQPLSAMVPAGGLRPEAAARIAIEIAAGLAHAHQRGILHRDLKPSNIVCDAEGHPKILGFGISARLPHVAAQDITRTSCLSSRSITGRRNGIPTTGRASRSQCSGRSPSARIPRFTGSSFCRSAASNRSSGPSASRAIRTS